MLKLPYTIQRKDNLPLGNGKTFHRILYKVRGRICAFIDVHDDKYRVCLGKPSDTEVLSWNYTNDPDGIGKHEAIAKAVSICENSVAFYNAISS